MSIFDDPKEVKSQSEINFDEENIFNENFLTGHGADFIIITEEHIKKLREGKILCTNSQGEYGVYIKLKKEKNA